MAEQVAAEPLRCKAVLCLQGPSKLASIINHIHSYKQSRMVVAAGWGEGGGNREKVVKRHKLLVVR